MVPPQRGRRPTRPLLSQEETNHIQSKNIMPIVAPQSKIADRPDPERGVPSTDLLLPLDQIAERPFTKPGRQ